MNEAKAELILSEMDMLETEIKEARELLCNLNVEVGLKGTIVFKWVKCGKSGCRCVTKGEYHGPYPHLQWWERGKIKTKYINRKIFERYVQKTKDAQQMRRLTRTITLLEKRKRQLLRESNRIPPIFS